MRNSFLCALTLVAACGSDTDDRPVRFSYIHPAIIVPNCATSGCHSTLTQTKGIDLLSRASAREVLANEVHIYQDIILLLRGKVPNYFRMPPDQPLPDADIDLIERWILAGAKDD